MKIFPGCLILQSMIEEKPILSIETSGNLCGACIYFSDDKYFEANVQFKNSHAEKLFEAIDFVVKSAGIETSQLGAVAVSSGPGSFTGLRIGMSASKGIAFGASLPIVPVPTFEALALEISAMLPDDTQFIVANKVNVEEIYYAKFHIKSNNFIFVHNLRIINYSEFNKLAMDSIVFGNAQPGNAESDNIKRVNLSSPSPKFVAKWCKQFGDELLVFDYDYLEPNYLKNFIISVSARLSNDSSVKYKPNLDGKEKKNA